MKKTLCILMALMLVCISLVACNDPVSDNSEASEVSDSEEELFSHLPDVNYAEGGKPSEFVILTIGDWSGAYKSVEILPHELSPELLQEAVIERNARVEERFGVKASDIGVVGTESFSTAFWIKINKLAAGETYQW